MSENSNVTSLHYRDAMARYAGHVQIVTTEHEGVRRGVTVTAACSVSDGPPSVLVCINSSNDKNAIFEKSGAFALNSLASHHQELANAFAGFGSLDTDKRFAHGEWLKLSTGSPVLSDATVSFDCKLTEIKYASTHLILFGEVQAVHFGPEASALIYMNRSFKTL